jgi:hypothetical protein
MLALKTRHEPLALEAALLLGSQLLIAFEALRVELSVPVGWEWSSASSRPAHRLWLFSSASPLEHFASVRAPHNAVLVTPIAEMQAFWALIGMTINVSF